MWCWKKESIYIRFGYYFLMFSEIPPASSNFSFKMSCVVVLHITRFFAFLRLSIIRIMCFFNIFRECLWHGVCYKYYLQSGHVDFELLYSNCVNYRALCAYFHSYKTKIQRYLQIWCLHCFWNETFRPKTKRKHCQPPRETWCVLTRFFSIVII